jgi:eukaryotic-like serine/threonine-protein kinase
VNRVGAKEDTTYERSDGRDGGGSSTTAGGSSAGDFLRELAFAPPVDPPGPERDRTGEAVGRFRLTGLLGRGGMGVVYAAFDPLLRRKIALKLLRAPAAGGDERRHFAREARAAAAVSHPNIVTVFEVGEAGGDVFIAMELVAGSDLRAWLAARPRSPRAIVEAFAMAGRGLAAAHRAGLVHRDFKPDNVLIDATGRARVADFGLARVADLGPAADAVPPSQADVDAGGASARSTRHARVAGTAGYVAPEHLAGRVADGRSDQFAFCVSLYEALEKRRPYDGAALEAFARGRSAPPALRLRATPRWLRGILTRGLALDPAARFPHVDDLLAALDRAKTRPRRTAAIGATAWISAAAALWTLGPRPPAPGAIADEVPAAWLARRGAVREAFGRAGVPYAADAADHVRLKLDDWTERWARARRSTCRGESCNELDPAAVCLARQRADFDAALSLLERADAQVVARAAAIVDGLGDPRRCVDGPPAAPPSPGLAGAEALVERVARARTLLASGKYLEGVALAEALRRDARGVPAVEADAFAVAALLAWKAGSPDAVAALTEARWAAERARRDALSTELALALAAAHQQRGDRERAFEWLGHADATRARVGQDARLASMALAARADLEARRDDRHAAYALALEALSLRERALGPGHLEVAEVLILAAASTPFDRLEEGRGLARRALDVRVKELGGGHPDVAAAWSRLGQLHRDLCDHRRELEAQENAMRVLVASVGEGHPDVARTHWRLGTALNYLGRQPDALAHFRAAHDMLVRAEGPTSRQANVAELVIAEIEAELGDVEAGYARARAALGRLDATLGPDSPDLVFELGQVADLAVARGDMAEAEHLYARALSNAERRAVTRSKTSPSLVGLSRLALARGRPDEARDDAARAVVALSSLYPANHPEALSPRRALLDAAIAAGDLDEAAKQAELHRAIVDAWMAADDPRRVDELHVRASLAAAMGDRPRATALAREALALQQTRPWQALRLADARAKLARALGPGDAEANRLVGEAVRALRAAHADGRANALAASWHPRQVGRAGRPSASR